MKFTPYIKTNLLYVVVGLGFLIATWAFWHEEPRDSADWPVRYLNLLAAFSGCVLMFAILRSRLQAFPGVLTVPAGFLLAVHILFSGTPAARMLPMYVMWIYLGIAAMYFADTLVNAVVRVASRTS